jgi:hypothetical protein
MEMRKENVAERRKRKMVHRRPELVRSVKAGQVLSVTYAKDNNNGSQVLWKP